MRKKGLIVLVIMILFLFMGAASAASTNKNVNLNDKRFTTVNLPFVENHGQISDKSVKYTANTFIGNVYVKDNGIVYTLNKNKTLWVVSEKFMYSNSVKVKGQDLTKTRINYYKGKSKETNLKTYSTVKYSNLYKGINLYLKAHGKNIEKIFAIGNQGNPNKIIISVNGSKKLKVNKYGELEILNGHNALKLTKPVAYQVIRGKKVNVSVSYVVKNSCYGFKTGAYNKKYKLVIDPLLSSTFLGGISYDNAKDVTIDRAGNIYVTGYTGSTNFPTFPNPGAYQNTITNGEWDVFVSKFNSNLSTLLDSTYIGGTLSDKATSIALDQSGTPGCNVFITGVTYSHDYPNTSGFSLDWDSGSGDVFITKLASSNLAYETSTFYGGNRSDIAYGILVDASNNVYVTGQTFSFNGTDPAGINVTGYPVRFSGFNEPTAHTGYVGNGDIFVTKFNNNLDDLTSGVEFGGSGTSYANAIAIDQSNNIYITGATNSSAFPLVNNTNVYPNNGFQSNKGTYDAFIVKLSAQYLENIEGVALLGGSARDVGNGIAVDPLGRVYIVGGTWSTNMYTTKGAKQRVNNGKEDAFLVVMDKEIQNVLSSSYLGGNGIDVANDVIVSDQGTIGIVGTTTSTQNFLNELDNGDTTPHGMEDVFFSAFVNPMTAQEKVETTFLGGANADYGQGIAIFNGIGGEAGNVVLVGDTWSNDYPTTNGAYSPTAPDMYQYVDDAFISKLDDILDTDAPTPGPTDPIRNAVNVPRNKVIKIVYSEKILASTNFPSITLNNGSTDVPITVSITGTSLNTLVIQPNSLLSWNTNYTLYIPVNAIVDYNGNVADDFVLNFRTIAPLTITNTNPVNNANNVVGNQPIKITFNKNIKAGSQYNQIALMRGGTKIAVKKSISGNVLTITPTINLSPGLYTLNLPANSILDFNNTGISVDYPINFSVSQPTVTSTDPVNGAVNVPTNKLIAVKFNRPIKAGSLSITLKASNGAAMNISYRISNNILYIYHTSKALLKNITYTLTLNPNSIQDLAGNGLQNTFVTRFKTGSV